MTIDKSEVYRILTNIRFDGGRQMSSEVVIQLAGAGEPYRVLSWRDDVEMTDNRFRTVGG